MLLFEAQKYLEIVRKRGKAKSELKRVYYDVATNEDLYLKAYANLYANKGAMTPGINAEDTVDGMSVKRIKKLMNKLQRREYRWTPVRRVYIEKKNSSKMRPLGMPGWTDKLLQEVIRMVLEAYYEPQFRESSHGFRPGRGCHTALDSIKTWNGTKWFIEGDIKGCFDNISHDVVLNILGRHVKDKTFLNLIEGMLKAGYVEDWTYYETYSGTPQGGTASPLLANIVLNELDRFVEDYLIPKNTRGKSRRDNPEYTKLAYGSRQARLKGDWNEAKRLRKMYTKLPSRDQNDPGFRRLRYVRYADDFLLSYAGTKQEAREIKQEISGFLNSIELEMSEEKTLITNARKEKARFLKYQLNRIQDDGKATRVKNHPKTGTHNRRAVNQLIHFAIPEDVTKDWLKRVEKDGKVLHRKELLNLSDYDIIMTYETELQGLINYYNRAHNQRALMSLRYKWGESLLKTLANKHKISRNRARLRYGRFYNEGGNRLPGVEIQREGKKPLRAVFGKKPIQRQEKTLINDKVQTIYINRNELLNRLLADTCELCGKEDVPVHAHHVRKLKDLQERWKGKAEKPKWVLKIIRIKRKTLFVCKECHDKIHAGTYDGRKIT
jgi:group II intron reverse transcriptase/maturase